MRWSNRRSIANSSTSRAMPGRKPPLLMTKGISHKLIGGELVALVETGEPYSALQVDGFSANRGLPSNGSGRADQDEPAPMVEASSSDLDHV